MRCKTNREGRDKSKLVNEASAPLDVQVAGLQLRQAVPSINVRGVYIQRNQVGLMLDMAACIVGPKPEPQAMQIDFL